MSPKQKALYFNTWREVQRRCPEMDRHEFHIQIFGEDKSSAAFTNEDLDKFLEHAWRITRPANVNAQIRQMNQQKTRLVWKLEVYLCNFIRLYRPDPYKYALAVIRDQLGFALPEPGADQPETTQERLASGLRELNATALEHLRSTLTARLNDMRNAAHHTIHDMHILAGVPCPCAPCAKRRRITVLNHTPAAKAPEPLPF